MAAVSSRRIALGTLVGGAVWGIWSTVVNMVILAPKYAFAQKTGLVLAQPRYPLFVVYWFITLFVLTYILTWVYVSVRSTLGAGPVTALRVGFLVGFVSGFPISLSLATWAPFSRAIPLWWMLDLWVGSMLATLVSAWLYKET
ncbi:MAG: hypothetical protein ABSA41_00745 [Terriglobia bacterium]|jgi:hypothetical protein